MNIELKNIKAGIVTATRQRVIQITIEVDGEKRDLVGSITNEQSAKLAASLTRDVHPGNQH